MLEPSWQACCLETSKPSELKEHAVPGALIADRPLSARFLQTVVDQKPRKLGTCGPWFHGGLRQLVIQRLSGTWELGNLSSQKLESQKTGEQQIEETGCHGSKEPRRLFQVGTYVPRDVQKLGKWVSRQLSTLRTWHIRNLRAEETRHHETKRPGRLGLKLSSKKGTQKPWCPETLESINQGSRERWSRGIDLTRSHGQADKTREIETYRLLATGCRQAGKGGLCVVSR